MMCPGGPERQVPRRTRATTPAPDTAPTTPSASATSSTTPHDARRWKFSAISLIPSLLALAGTLLFLYPSISAWIVQYNQSQIIAQCENSVSKTNPPTMEQLALTYRYDDALSSGAVLQTNSNVSTGDGTSGDASLDYNTVLVTDSSGLMGRLKVPAVDINLPIYHSTDDETLLRGLGHLEGMPLPVNGQGQRIVVTGYRGLAEAHVFIDLDKVQVGGTFTFEVFGEVLAYRVFDRKVVNPEETEALRSEPGRDLTTLVTCIPPGTNTHHILVTGERVYPTSQRDIDAVSAAPNIPGFPWWALGLLGRVSPIGLYIWRSGYPPHPKRHPTPNK